MSWVCRPVRARPCVMWSNRHEGSPSGVPRTCETVRGRRREGGMIAVAGLLVGVVLGLILQPSVPVELQPYLPIAVVAALDALFGAVRARLGGVFDERVFVTSFLFNVVIAALLVFLGDQLGVGSQLSTAVVVVLGIRIFSNAASIRRHVFKA